MPDDEDVFSFEPEEKEEKKSGIQKMEDKLENELNIIPQTDRLPDYDYITGFLVVGEVILLLYGVWLLLG